MDAQASTQVADQITMTHVHTARKILTLMGRAISPSTEPGADYMVDKVAAVIAAAQPVSDPMAWVLLRHDEDGLEPIMFFGGADKPKDDYKDRFELRPVWLNPQPPAQPVSEPAQADTLDARMLTMDEINVCLTALRDHDGSDFDSDCPGCTAYTKLAAMQGSKP